MGSPIKRHLSREKNNQLARNSVFFLGTRRLREWAAKWLVGAAAHLIDSFAPEPIPPNALRKSPFLFLTQDDPYGIINFFPFAVVSLGLSMSVLRAPVTHQDQGLQKNGFSSETPVPFHGTQKIFGSRPCPIRRLQISWLLANPWGLTAWAVKTLMTYKGRGGTVANQTSWFFTNPTPGSPFQPKSLPE